MERSRDPYEPGFEEALYQHLQAAPWWLASAGIHAVAFLMLGLLAGGEPALAVERPIVGRIQAPETELEPDIEPDILKQKPIVEDFDPPVEPVPDFREVEPDVASPEAGPETGDPRLPPGPFEGMGNNPHIGVGPGAGGGGGGIPFITRRTLRPQAPRDALDATDAALDWLVRHQDPDGRWSSSGFEARCKGNRCGGPGGPLHDTGVTGLSLLAFLGTGETHTSPVHGTTVRGALRHLKGVQDAEGCFGSRTASNFVYDHAIAALAMTEAYGMTQSPLFRRSAQSGVDFVHQSRNPYMAWRYGVRPQDNDTSVTGWMVMVLKSAALSGLEVDPGALEGTITFLDKVTEPEYGRAGYTARGNGPARPQELVDRFPADRSESLTAVAVLTRILCGQRTEDPMVRKGADLLLKCLPVHDEAAGTVDHYYWYYGSLAMFQVGGEHWVRWKGAMEKAILPSQRRDRADDRYGSWDPIDPWASEGGRVYSTAINALSTEVYYRHKRVAGTR